MMIALGMSPILASAQMGGMGVGLPAVSFAAGGTGLTSFYVLGFELGPWQEYLAQELTPSYLLPDNVEPVNVSWLRNSDAWLLPDFASGLEQDSNTYFYLNFESQSDSTWPGANNLEPDADFTGSLFERQYFAPGFEQHLADNSVLGVAAVIAYQRFSTARLGMVSATTPENLWMAAPNVYSPYEESGYGTGVRLALRQEITSGLAFETGFQSRIDMEEFAQYRGVYSNPADLDIPARASVGLQLQASQRSWVNVAVERVLYSDINAFPSRYLPNRLLALLGDSTSPTFEWDDLTVYSVGWTWSDGDKQQWHVDYSTRQQPSPSSLLLSQALESDLADNAITLGYALSTTRNSRLHLNAAYAPSEFAFGGSVLGVTTEELDQRFELEALWTLSF
jgi:long-chain fatty acid transport protein